MADHQSRKLEGVIGYFNDEYSLIEATAKVRDANYESIDTFTPYPVHGLEDAQGLRRSPLPYITFTFGLTGLICAFLLQYWTSAVSWPLNVGGKPFNSWPAFVPIMFELTVLFAGISTVLGMFALNRLPNITKKIPDPSLTRDRFAIMIEAPNDSEDHGPRSTKYKAFSEDEASEFLKGVGAQNTQKVYQEGWF